jgi:hypothetical protein
MTTKEKVVERIQSLPDDVGVKEIRDRLVFILGVQEALDSVERGETISKDKVKGMIKEWITS